METGKGYPDITLLEPIADAFSVSVTELISGSTVTNSYVAANMMRSHFFICPVCGNVIHSVGGAVIHCHGVLLQPEEAEETDEEHKIFVERIYFYCNRSGLFYLNPIVGIDDRESGYDDSEERRELEKAARMLFG